MKGPVKASMYFKSHIISLYTFYYRRIAGFRFFVHNISKFLKVLLLLLLFQYFFYKGVVQDLIKVGVL